MDFMDGIFCASFGGINCRIEPEEMEQLKAAFDDLQIADQRNNLSQSVKYIRSYNYCSSSGYIIEKQTTKTATVRPFSEGRVLENLAEDCCNKEYFMPHKKVMTIDNKDILTGHTAITIAAYEKALFYYENAKHRINEKIKDRFASDLIHAIYEATKQQAGYGIYLHR